MDEENLSPERLVVLEHDGIYVVANEEDPSDWVAAFTPADRFPARDWAERMAELFNLRTREGDTDEPQSAPIFTGSHHPANE
jgi:hypothetical protein